MASDRARCFAASLRKIYDGTHEQGTPVISAEYAVGECLRRGDQAEADEMSRRIARLRAQFPGWRDSERRACESRLRSAARGIDPDRFGIPERRGTMMTTAAEGSDRTLRDVLADEADEIAAAEAVSAAEAEAVEDEWDEAAIGHCGGCGRYGRVIDGVCRRCQ